MLITTEAPFGDLTTEELIDRCLAVAGATSVVFPAGSALVREAVRRLADVQERFEALYLKTEETTDGD